MTTPLLTYRERAGQRVHFDTLIQTRLLVQTNSGGGKSHAIRQLLEDTSGRVQQFVIDREGEFSTLREKFDYLLVGPGGEVAADLRSAPLLARKLLELGVSAVVDLSEMALSAQRQYVAAFVNALSEAPRALWHDVLVIIDEAHLFAPQKFKKGEKFAAESLAAIALAASIWRKRGFCLGLATQRIAKLDNDVAAELLNKLIGRTSEEDRKRAADELGMNNEGSRALKQLAPGHFWAYGPAISNEPVLVRTEKDLKTHPPKRGAARESAPPTPAAIRAIADALAELPKEAAEEAHTVAGQRRQIVELERKLRAAERAAIAPAPAAPRIVEKAVVDHKAIDSAVAATVKRERDAFRRALSDGHSVYRRLNAAGASLAEAQTAFDTWQLALTNSMDKPLPMPLAPGRIVFVENKPVPVAKHVPMKSGDSTLPKGERFTLTAVAQHPEGVTREQLTVLTGYKRSTRDAFIQRLAAKGCVVSDDQRIHATPEGIAELGNDFTPLPTGDALREHWLAVGRLPEGERRVLEICADKYPESVTRDDIETMTGYKRSTRDAFIQRLAARRLVVASRGGVVMSENLHG